MAKGSGGEFHDTRGDRRMHGEPSEEGGEGPKYKPSQKHVAGYGWGSENPIKTDEEGQRLLDEGYSNGKQVYNVTEDGTIVKFQPDGTPENGYHSYAVRNVSEIVPRSILRRMVQDGKISRHRYNQILSGDL